MIQGTCGQTFFGSSEPAGHLSSWVNRLQERLATVGSTELPLIWNEKITPAGRSIYRLRPLTRRISGRDFTGSPWETPTLCGNYNRKGLSATSGDGLAMQVAATWATPTSRDWKDGSPTPNVPVNSLLGRQVWPATWPTPMAVNRERNEETMAKCAAFRLRNANAKTVPLYLGEVAKIAVSGPTPNGSQEQTEKPGALNPEFVFWLMGFPVAWQASASLAMQSFRKSRRK